MLVENAIQAVQMGYDPEEVLEAMVAERLGAVQEQLVDQFGNPLPSVSKGPVSLTLNRAGNRISQKAKELGRMAQWRAGQASQKAQEFGSMLARNKGKTALAVGALGAGAYALNRRRKANKEQAQGKMRPRRG